MEEGPPVRRDARSSSHSTRPAGRAWASARASTRITTRPTSGRGRFRATGLAALAAAVLLVLLGATPALAGTADDPEFTDPEDVMGNGGIDLVAGWVQEDAQAEALTFHLEVADLSSGPTALTSHTYRWSFRLGAAEHAARARADFSMSGTVWDFWLEDASGTRQASLDGTPDVGESRIRWTVPRDLVGDPAKNTTLADPWAEGVAVSTQTGSQTGRDRAPDMSFGRSYNLTEGPTSDGGTGNGGGGGDGDGTGGPDGSAFPFAALADPAVLLGLVGLVAAAILLAFFLIGRMGGLEMVCDQPRRSTRPGQGTNFPLRIENRGRRPVKAALSAEDVPDDWVAFLPLPTLTLEGRSAKDLWITLKAPADAEPGDAAEVTVRAESRDAPGGPAEVRVRADVVEKAAAAEK